MPALSDGELETLLHGGESDRNERKRNAADLDKIREAVCAFSNDLPDRRQPGVVFVGVEDDGTCSNLTIDDDLLRLLGNVRDDGALTPFPVMEVRQATIRGCSLAVIIVQPTLNPPVRFRGRAWVRVGPRRAIASPEEERRLVEKRRWGNLPFDAQPVAGSNLSDLDLNRFNLEYLPAMVSRDTIAQNQRAVVDQLRALRLIDQDETPTFTAIAMLGKSTQHWFPGASIAWRRVGGENLTDNTIDERVLTGTIPDQLRRIDEIIDAANISPVEMGTTVHTRAAEYPMAALQQLVRNALMHRTYEGTTSPVRVTWYSDRVEILSPGGPFGVVTPLTLGLPGYTDYRNPTLAEALKGYGFVERFGQGIEIARMALAQSGSPAPQFRCEPEEAPVWVHVTVRKRP
ncbi:MAG: putative DNA binding domain-containing protein [Proteobacteria bacterium]|nr:putative DNA binding domain-containing protein [Pseudomonadota bacterium]MBI3498095.1 putative DNA binding domain-containing protein [Pseudomonadota bacterium]